MGRPLCGGNSPGSRKAQTQAGFWSAAATCWPPGRLRSACRWAAGELGPAARGALGRPQGSRWGAGLPVGRRRLVPWLHGVERAVVALTEFAVLGPDAAPGVQGRRPALRCGSFTPGAGAVQAEAASADCGVPGSCAAPGPVPAWVEGIVFVPQGRSEPVVPPPPLAVGSSAGPCRRRPHAASCLAWPARCQPSSGWVSGWGPAGCSHLGRRPGGPGGGRGGQFCGPQRSRRVALGEPSFLAGKPEGRGDRTRRTDRPQVPQAHLLWAIPRLGLRTPPNVPVSSRGDSLSLCHPLRFVSRQASLRSSLSYARSWRPRRPRGLHTDAP